MAVIPRILEKKYAPTVISALLALLPYLFTTSASALYAKQLASDLHTEQGAMEFVSALSTAAYAFGALAAGDLINRFNQRHLFLVFSGLLGVAWLLSAVAHGIILYGAGQVLAGLVTGMLLVVALPPTIQNFPTARVPLTAAFINMGLFGGIAAGPLIGGATAALEAWRTVYLVFAGLGVATLALGAITLPDEPAKNPDLPLDITALLLALGCTFLLFGATGVVGGVGFTSPKFLVPLTVGLVCFVALLLVEYHKEEPLAPIAKMCNTWPIFGTVIATVGGGVFVTLTRLLTERRLTGLGAPPLNVGMAFWPTLAGALIAAVVLGLLFRSRYLPVLIGTGMLALIAAAVLLMAPNAASDKPSYLAAAALLGIGAGATVSPGLFMAGFSLPSKSLGRIISLVELVRSVGDFLLAPLLLQVAKGAPGVTTVGAPGMGKAVAITLGIAIVGSIACMVLLAGARTGLPKPDLEEWLDNDGTALDSPPLLAAWRGAGR